MESICSGFVPAPNKSDRAEAAEVMVRSLVPLWHKSGTAVRCLLPLPWLSLCAMPWLSVTGGTRLQSEQNEKEHRKRKVFFSWISSWPGSVIWLHKLQCHWRGRQMATPWRATIEIEVKTYTEGLALQIPFRPVFLVFTLCGFCFCFVLFIFSFWHIPPYIIEIILCLLWLGLCQSPLGWVRAN